MIAKQKIEVGQSYEDYLIMRGKLYEKKRQEEQAKKDMEDLESKECTFKPVVLSSKRKGEGNESIASKQLNSASKWDELYHQAGRKQGKVDRDADEIEFERNHQEMRFAPEVHEINH
jgi:hypothetical protein